MRKEIIILQDASEAPSCRDHVRHCTAVFALRRWLSLQVAVLRIQRSTPTQCPPSTCLHGPAQILAPALVFSLMHALIMQLLQGVSVVRPNLPPAGLSEHTSPASIRSFVDGSHYAPEHAEPSCIYGSDTKQSRLRPHVRCVRF